MLALTLVSLTLCAAPIEATSPSGIRTWTEASNAEGWASVAVAIDRSGETDLDALEELVSRLAGYGADVLAARGGQTRAYLLEDALVVVDSVPAADLLRAVNFASARLMRPLEATRVPVERRPLPRAARDAEIDVSLDVLRARLLVRERVVVAVVAPGEVEKLAQQVSRGVRTRLPSGQSNHRAAVPARTVPGPDGPIYLRPRDRSAANLAADHILAKAVGGELRVGSDRIVLVPSARNARDARSARDRARADLEKTAAHPADRAMALARLGLAVTGGLSAVQVSLASPTVDRAEIAASAERFGFELPELPGPAQPAREELKANAPVVASIPRGDSPWSARVVAIPSRSREGLRSLAVALAEPERYGSGFVQTLIARGGALSARARPEGIVLIIEGPTRLANLIANATREVLAGPDDFSHASTSTFRRTPHTAAFWSTAFGRVPAVSPGSAAAAWKALDLKRAAIFVEGEAETSAAPRWKKPQLWSVSSGPVVMPRPSSALIASQVVPFVPRVLAEGEAVAGVLEARVRRLYPRARVRFETTRGAALLGVRVPLEAADDAALEKVRETFGSTRSVTRAELRLAFAAVAVERASRRARIGAGAADLAAHYLVTGAVDRRDPDEQNLARLLWTLPEPRALRSLSVGAAAAPGGSG